MKSRSLQSSNSYPDPDNEARFSSVRLVARALQSSANKLSSREWVIGQAMMLQKSAHRSGLSPGLPTSSTLGELRARGSRVARRGAFRRGRRPVGLFLACLPLSRSLVACLRPSQPRYSPQSRIASTPLRPRLERRHTTRLSLSPPPFRSAAPHPEPPHMPGSRTRSILALAALLLAVASAQPGRFPCGSTSPDQAHCDALSHPTARRGGAGLVPVDSECVRAGTAGYFCGWAGGR